MSWQVTHTVDIVARRLPPHGQSRTFGFDARSDPATKTTINEGKITSRNDDCGGSLELQKRARRPKTG